MSAEEGEADVSAEEGEAEVSAEEGEAEVSAEDVKRAFREVVEKLKNDIGWKLDGFSRADLGKIYSDDALKEWFLKTMVPKVLAKVKEVRWSL